MKLCANWAILLVLSAAPVRAELPGLDLPGAGTVGASVKAQIFADTDAARPGGIINVAIVLTTNPGWHIYWQNPGDGGIATEFTFSLPKGFKAEPVRFPVPKTFVQPGGIVNYGYEGKTIFLARITAPEQLPEGELKIRCDVTWLCCKEACVAGAAQLNLALGKDPSNMPAQSNNKELFTEGEAAMAAPDVPKETADAKVTVGAVNGTQAPVSVEIAWKQAPANVEAYPTELENFSASGLNVQTRGTTSTMEFTARALNHQPLKVDHYPLIVAYTDSAGKRHGFTVDVDLSPLKTTTGN